MGPRAFTVVCRATPGECFRGFSDGLSTHSAEVSHVDFYCARSSPRNSRDRIVSKATSAHISPASLGRQDVSPPRCDLAMGNLLARDTLSAATLVHVASQ